MTTLVLSGLVVFVTHALEAVTGFGCSVLAMPFVSALLGVKTAVKVITILAWLLALYIVIRNFSKIDWRQYSIITGLMLLGLPVGMYLFRSRQSSSLNLILAVFIIVVSVSQLYRQARRTGDSAPPTGYKVLPYYLFLFLGGIV
ncbi:MAG: TSUP family transporter, partial [Sphaerochaeta sp.]